MSQDDIEMSVTEVGDSEKNETNLEYLQRIANSFPEISERYEQIKKEVQKFEKNIEEIKEQVDEMKVQLSEKFEAFGDLQTRAEEMLEDAQSGVFIDKEAYDAKIVDLKARMKATEFRISSIKRVVTNVPLHKRKKSLDDEKKENKDDMALD